VKEWVGCFGGLAVVDSLTQSTPLYPLVGLAQLGLRVLHLSELAKRKEEQQEEILAMLEMPAGVDTAAGGHAAGRPLDMMDLEVSGGICSSICSSHGSSHGSQQDRRRQGQEEKEEEEEEDPHNAIDATRVSVKSCVCMNRPTYLYQ